MKLIDTDEFKHKWVDSFDTYYGEDCAKFFKDIFDATPIDCELDKHKEENIPKEKAAHWLPRKEQRRGETRHWMCSKCKRDVWLDTVRLENPYNYCPWCGAKMELDEVCYD